MIVIRVRGQPRNIDDILLMLRLSLICRHALRDAHQRHYLSSLIIAPAATRHYER